MPRSRHDILRAALSLCLLATCSATLQADEPSLADPKTYLADVVAQLEKTWPANRTLHIVTHGHSVPAGYFKTPIVDTFNAYPHLLHVALKARHPHAVINVINTSIGGENSVSGAARFERDVLSLKPDLITIDYALNDRGVGLDKAREAWTAMIEKAAARNVKVLLLTPTADLGSKLDDPNDPLHQHAAQIRKLAAQYHLPLVDSLAAFQQHVKSGGKMAELMSQGNHPNRAGHDLVVKELMAWFPAPPRPLVKTTHVYKTVGDVKIEADVYRSEGNATRPVLVWIHGGALIVGGRPAVPNNLLDFCTQNDVILVSIDYRLAPEVKLPEIAADVRDAFTWLRSEGPKKFGADPDRIVVSGGSAGGYLTMLVGATVKPRPVALLAYWGYGDIDGPWTEEKSTHHGTTSPEERDAALAGVGKRVLTNTNDPAEAKIRGQYYRMLRQTGRWAREVTGIDPSTKGALDAYSPVRQITSDYPPILMIHGTADTDVPYSLSADMARELTKHKVEHELITIPNAEHGLRDGDPKLVADANRRALEYLKKWLK